MNDPNELRSLLADYTGSIQPFRHGLVAAFFYTDGVRAFAQNAGNGAYWLLDILATEPAIRKGVMDEGFAVVALEVADRKARLVVASDSSDDAPGGYVGVMYERTIDFTDCPSGSWKFYLEPTMVGRTTGVMLMLPSER